MTAGPPREQRSVSPQTAIRHRHFEIGAMRRLDSGESYNYDTTTAAAGIRQRHPGGYWA
jgi:hypothetical protein